MTAPNTKTILFIGLLFASVSVALLALPLQREKPALNTKAGDTLRASAGLAEENGAENREALSSPSSAAHYYRTLEKDDYATYIHPLYRFTFPYPKDFILREFTDEQGEVLLVEKPELGMGFQIFISPFGGEPEALTAELIQESNPNPIEDVTEFAFDGAIRAFRFTARDPLLGETRELWFAFEGMLYQITMQAPAGVLDPWIREIPTHFKFLRP